MLVSFQLHTLSLASHFIDSICFFMYCGRCWYIIHVPPTFDDHKPKVGMRVPGWLDHKLVWIYLSNLEFISSLSGVVFLLDVKRAVLSQFHLKLLGAYGRLLRAVRLKWSTSSLVEERACQGACRASWHRLVWMCVIKPTQCCLRRRLGVKVVSQLFFKNRVVVLSGFLWCWCAQDCIPHRLVLLIWWLSS